MPQQCLCLRSSKSKPKSLHQKICSRNPLQRKTRADSPGRKLVQEGPYGYSFFFTFITISPFWNFFAWRYGETLKKSYACAWDRKSRFFCWEFFFQVEWLGPYLPLKLDFGKGFAISDLTSQPKALFDHVQEWKNENILSLGVREVNMCTTAWSSLQVQERENQIPSSTVLTPLESSFFF